MGPLIQYNVMSGLQVCRFESADLRQLGKFNKFNKCKKMKLVH